MPNRRIGLILIKLKQSYKKFKYKKQAGAPFHKGTPACIRYQPCRPITPVIF